MYANDENNNCYEFSECIDPTNQKSINDLCENDGEITVMILILLEDIVYVSTKYHVSVPLKSRIEIYL